MLGIVQLLVSSFLFFHLLALLCAFGISGCMSGDGWYAAIGSIICMLALKSFCSFHSFADMCHACLPFVAEDGSTVVTDKIYIRIIDIYGNGKWEAESRNSLGVPPLRYCVDVEQYGSVVYFNWIFDWCAVYVSSCSFDNRTWGPNSWNSHLRLWISSGI